MEREEILEKTQAIIADVIEVDTDEIELGSSLVDDLGIESVDLVDISVRIEGIFNIEIAKGELWNLGEFFAYEDTVENGRLTKRGVELLQKQCCGDLREIEPGVSIVEIFSMIRVKTIVDYLSQKLKQVV